MKIVNCISTINELNVSQAKQLGIGIEIQDFVEPNLTKQNKYELIKRYKKELKGFKHPIAIHGPFLDLKPASPDMDIRKVSLIKYLEALSIAHEIGASFLIFHSQINPNIKQTDLVSLNNKQTKQVYDWLLRQSSYNKTIAIENVFEDGPDAIKDLITVINSNRISINLDIGHANISKMGLEEWVRALGGGIRYVHLHSNNGLIDEHKRPSDAFIENTIRLFKKYSLDPLIALEYKIDDLEKEVIRLRRIEEKISNN